jgi:hypothetical protein
MSKEKDEMRKRLSSLTFTEKIKILEKLRDRSLTLASSGLSRRNPSKQAQDAKPSTENLTKEG